MKWNKLYHYPPSTRSTTDGLRTYDVGEQKLPSVTTILGATKSQESQDSIAKWQARVGQDEATRIRDQAASRGTNMHKHLEQHLLGAGHLDLTPEGKIAKAMADTIIAKGFKDFQKYGAVKLSYITQVYTPVQPMSSVSMTMKIRLSILNKVINRNVRSGLMIILCSSERMRWLITMFIEPRSHKGLF